MTGCSVVVDECQSTLSHVIYTTGGPTGVLKLLHSFRSYHPRRHRNVNIIIVIVIVI